ncbi:TlyA family RNA methyltransferase [Henriciella barbarensis]|uniref:TlyA family RNA methyltransferase n=1 Tax=Henriciella barbarensis TaxID=86342 RepID=A0A399R5V7_9PROT|nr:TlyA family RNA methyltransferase [Henriciella barbarensis]RIJ26044.1 TlyA family RNA methyltransferase [Henriciella barbarensis]
MTTERLDKALVTQGYFDSRSAAQAAVAAGTVLVNGRPASKTSQLIGPSDRLEAEPAHPYVSRGGLKLDHALDVFGVDPAGRHCLDVGASTGGFTDVLIQRGAAHVVAVDVGRGQLHERIACDPRVTSYEATDARSLTSAMVGEAPSLIVCDASFISLAKLLEAPLSLAGQGAELVTLFKPQFEVGREFVGKGGMVTDAGAVARAEAEFCDWLADMKWAVSAKTDSPIRGGDGNAERLLHAVQA